MSKMYKSKMVEEKTWQDFRETGLFMMINTILHAFGWAMVVMTDDETGEVIRCFPARVKFRGFNEDDQDEMHKRIAGYLKANADELDKEANS